MGLRGEFDIASCSDALAVVAGFGDVGAGANQKLHTSGVSCAVIDAKSQGIEQVIGNAQDEGAEKTCTEKARFCIVALNDLNINIFTTLMDRNLNPVICILFWAKRPLKNSTVQELIISRSCP